MVTIKSFIKPLIRPLRTFLFKLMEIYKMNNLHRWKQYKELYLDHESIDILRAREIYIRSNNLTEFSVSVRSITNQLYRIKHILCGVDKIALCGEGDVYSYSVFLLQNSDFTGEIVLLGDDYGRIAQLNSDYSLLIASEYNVQKDMAKRLRMKYPDFRILNLEEDVVIDGLLIGSLGNQYFDVISPNDNEIVIDCGSYDGTTEEEILKWGNGKIERIYAFELDPLNASNCERFYEEKGYDNIVLIKGGTGRKSKYISLEDGTESSRGTKVGTGSVRSRVFRIDDIVRDEKITFIKMDIEGAELDSLKGAKKTIKKNKPRLAICLYHKPEDIYRIPKYIHHIVPDYRFVVRHYTSMPYETVLYCVL